MYDGTYHHQCTRSGMARRLKIWGARVCVCEYEFAPHTHALRLKLICRNLGGHTLPLPSVSAIPGDDDAS